MFIKQFLNWGIILGVIPILSKTFLYFPKDNNASSVSDKSTTWEIWLKNIIWSLAIVIFVLIIFWQIIIKNYFLISCLILLYWLEQINDNIHSSVKLKEILKSPSGNVLSLSEWQSIVSIVLFISYTELHRIPEFLIKQIDAIPNSNISGILLLIFLFFISIIYLLFTGILIFEFGRVFLKIFTKVVRYFLGDKSKTIFNWIKYLYDNSRSKAFFSISFIEKNKNSKYGLFFFVPLLMSLDVIILLTYFFYRIIISILFYITMIVYKFVILSGKIISVISNWSDRKVTVFFFRLSFVFSIMFLVTFNRIYPIAKMNIESTAVLEFLSGSILIPILLSWILELKNKPLNEKKSKEIFLSDRKKISKRKYK